MALCCVFGFARSSVVVSPYCCFAGVHEFGCLLVRMSVYACLCVCVCEFVLVCVPVCLLACLCVFVCRGVVVLNYRDVVLCTKL